MPGRLPPHTYYRASSSPDSYPSLQGGRECAVCVIGAGFAGLGTAMSLAERGERDVVVLEAEEVGHGASGRNGGFVFGGFSLGERALQRSAGPAARQLYGDTLAAVGLIRARIRRHDIACEARESGVILANWFEDERILVEQQRFMAEHMGVHWQHLGRDELSDRLRTRRYKGCGGYLASLHRRLRAAILPIATYVMTTEPLGERLASSIRTDAAVYDTRFAFDYYRALPDTRLLWGGRISILHRSPRAVARLLYGDMLKVYPQLKGVRVEHAWSGLMSYARHKMPQVGRLPDGLWYGMGFGGHGVAPTTLAGELLAGALTGEGGPLRQYARWGLPWTGGPAGLAAAQATYWYYGLRDLLRR